jgi:hypothetical protein
LCDERLGRKKLAGQFSFIEFKKVGLVSSFPFVTKTSFLSVKGVDFGVHLQGRRPDVFGEAGRLFIDSSEVEGEGTHYGDGPDVQGKLVRIIGWVIFLCLSIFDQVKNIVLLKLLLTGEDRLLESSS